ncbi:hypothetical protein [Streptomyces sp. NPDC051776]|uniref:hypothetical protein n=1 Tax=Streptomyces sp. NPDC051776 TaxID=3155414 RepID=UPI003427A50E
MTATETTQPAWQGPPFTTHGPRRHRRTALLAAALLAPRRPLARRLARVRLPRVCRAGVRLPRARTARVRLARARRAAPAAALLAVADVSDTVQGHRHEVFTDGSGSAVVESYTLTGMGHGQPVDPGGGTEQCGVTGPYVLDANICASYRIARSWGLDS